MSVWCTLFEAQKKYFPPIFDDVIWDLRSLSGCRKTFLPKTVLLQKQQLGMSGKVCRRLGCDDCSCCSARSAKLQNSSFSSLKLGWKIRLLNTNCSPHAISLAEHDALRQGGEKVGGRDQVLRLPFFFLQIKIYPKAPTWLPAFLLSSLRVKAKTVGREPRLYI